jgi:acyl-CoA thioesterase
MSVQQASARTTLQAVLGSLAPDGSGGFSGHVPPDWMQGRTLYGGISAALCLAAARLEFPDLPPLRSAQLAFVGPAAGDVTLRNTLLRQGKSASFLTSDLTSEAGHGTRATFCFGADRPSAYRLAGNPAPPVAPASGAPDHFRGMGPAFARHFDVRIVSGSHPVSGAAEADVMLWLKALDDGAGPLEAFLLAIADVPPPAAMSLFTAPAPISTMTWMVDVLSPGVASADSWYLLRSVGETTGNGYSAQAMGLWSSDGTPILVGRQSVAIFA